MNTGTLMRSSQCRRVRPPSLRWGQALASVACGTVVLAALLAQVWPAGRDALAFHRPAVAAGEWWRVVTGHLVHCDWRHLVADVGAFALLCWIGLRRPRATLAVVMLSAGTAGLAVYLWAGGIAAYRGISGINYALLAWLLLARALEERGWRGLTYGAVLTAICGKAVFEVATGELVVNVCLPPGVQVVAVVHLAGIAVGAAVAIVQTQVSARPALPPAPPPSTLAPPVSRAGATMDETVIVPGR